MFSENNKVSKIVIELKISKGVIQEVINYIKNLQSSL